MESSGVYFNISTSYSSIIIGLVHNSLLLHQSGKYNYLKGIISSWFVKSTLNHNVNKNDFIDLISTSNLGGFKQPKQTRQVSAIVSFVQEILKEPSD